MEISDEQYNELRELRNDLMKLYNSGAKGLNYTHIRDLDNIVKDLTKQQF